MLQHISTWSVLLPTSSKPRHSTSASRTSSIEMRCEVWSNWRSDCSRLERAELGSTGPRLPLDAAVVSRCITNIPNIQKLIMLHNISLYISIIYIFYHTLSYLIYVSTGIYGKGQLCSHRFPLVHCVGKRAVEPALTRRLWPRRQSSNPTDDQSPTGPTGPPFKVVISL